MRVKVVRAKLGWRRRRRGRGERGEAVGLSIGWEEWVGGGGDCGDAVGVGNG